MPITRYPLRNEADLPRIPDLVRSLPDVSRHIVDLPWRLSALDLDQGCDAVFWEDAHGKMVGFAACQYVWAVLDFFILPGPEAEAIATDLFAWAPERFQERKWPYPSYRVEYRVDDHERQQFVKAHGFLPDEDLYVLFQHTLMDLSPVPTPPDGFQLRPLKGEQEVAAYVAIHRTAFESTAMTPEWRARTLHMPSYRPELDLVISTAEGELAGFCVGWFEPARGIAQIEPLGIHPRFHQLGLGRILLLEMLHRFKDHGATSAIVETNLGRSAARRAYEAVGFQQVHIISSSKIQINY